MDFIAVMLFTQQVFLLGCLSLFRIKSQPVVAYKCVVYKKAFNVFLVFKKWSVYPVFHWGNIDGKILPKVGISEQI